MTREDIEDLLRKGPPYTYVSEMLGVSRPTFYRQISLYKESQDNRMIDTVRRYFDMVAMGEIASEEEARKQLEQIHFITEAKGESKMMELNKARDELLMARISYDRSYHDMTSREKVDAQEKLDELQEKVRSMEDDADSKIPRDKYGRAIDRIVWNKGDIRSAVHSSFSNARIYIDADYDRCRNIAVEIFVDISGEDFAFAIYRPAEYTKYIEISDLPGNVRYRYRLKWTEDDK